MINGHDNMRQGHVGKSKVIKNLPKPDARLQSCSESVLWGFLPDLEGSAAFQRVELPFPSRRRGFG